MKKTSVYLSEDDALRLQRLAEQDGKSQADIIREGLAAYERDRIPDRNFAMLGAGEGDGSSVADTPEEELFQGFGS
jgi:predicted transcriptional regulator